MDSWSCLGTLDTDPYGARVASGFAIRRSPGCHRPERWTTARSRHEHDPQRARRPVPGRSPPAQPHHRDRGPGRRGDRRPGGPRRHDERRVRHEHLGRGDDRGREHRDPDPRHDDLDLRHDDPTATVPRRPSSPRRRAPATPAPGDRDDGARRLAGPRHGGAPGRPRTATSPPPGRRSSACSSDVDRTYSRFRPDSELMRLHAARGRTARSARCSPGRSGARSRLPARPVGPSTPRWAARCGSSATTPTSTSIAPASIAAFLTLRTGTVPGWSTVELDVAAGLLRIPADVELDLGSTGKGLAADLAAAAALAAAGPGAGVLRQPGRRHRDGRSRARRRLADHRGRGQRDDPGRRRRGAEVIAIAHGAVATSSTTVRSWRAADGVTVHHIVDPRTGGSALVRGEPPPSSAGTCETANAASTAAIVLGDAAPAWLEAAGLPGATRGPRRVPSSAWGAGPEPARRGRPRAAWRNRKRKPAWTRLWIRTPAHL